MVLKMGLIEEGVMGNFGYIMSWEMKKLVRLI